MGERAFTLFETLIVVLLLAIAAAGVSLFARPGDTELRLEAARSEVAAALRFARSEALRTGEDRAVQIDHGNEEVLVYEPDFSGGPLAVGPLLLDPLAKHPYSFYVHELPAAKGVEIVNTQPVFDFESIGPEQDVLFDASGLAVYQNPGGDRVPLVSASILVGSDAGSREVRLSPLGRVTLP